MSRLGYEPVKTTKGGNEFWYQSPFRTEKEASFHTSFLGGKWIWKDFGDIGGTVIDFVMRHQNYTSVSDVLRFLAGMFEGPLFDTPRSNRGGESQKNAPDLFSFQQQAAPQALEIFEDRQLEFLTAHKIANPLIHRYLEGRGIPPRLADAYLLEVAYRNKGNGKKYFAFGMQNESGGYEIRAASDEYKFKSALIARDITVIRGTSPERHDVNLFEGMTDFLSWLVLMHLTQPSADCIILHSLSSIKRACAFIRSENHRHIHTYFDNNAAGAQGTAAIIAEFAEMVSSESHLFAAYTDLNDALRANM
jgi:hypothetical protein